MVLMRTSTKALRPSVILLNSKQVKPTMQSEDYEEWRWGQILTRQTNFDPDDQPEDEEDAQTQE